MLIDLHTHTYPNSDDAFMAPDQLVEAAKRAGLDGICVTEHDCFWDAGDVLNLSRRHDFLVLPGCEVNTEGGHALVFGVNEYLFGMHKAAYLHQIVEQVGGALVAAHPYRRRYKEDQAAQPGGYEAMLESAASDPFFSLCDAIEGVNGRATAGETAFSLELARRLGLATVGGSDSHRPTHPGTVATRFRAKITSVADLITEIKAGRFEPVVLDGAGSSVPIMPFPQGVQGSE